MSAYSDDDQKRVQFYHSPLNPYWESAFKHWAYKKVERNMDSRNKTSTSDLGKSLGDYIIRSINDEESNYFNKLEESEDE